MGLTVYWHPLSPPSRAVRAVINELGVDAKYVVIDIPGGENKQPEYLKINPLGQVPCIDDGGFKLAESRPIMTYLVSKYGAADNALYPADLQRRAKINTALYQENAFYGTVTPYFAAIAFRKEKPSAEVEKKLTEGLDKLNKVLSPFLLGEQETLPDLALYQGLLQLEVFTKFDFSKWPKVKAALEQYKKKSYFFVLELPSAAKE